MLSAKVINGHKGIDIRELPFHLTLMFTVLMILLLLLLFLAVFVFPVRFS